jgi:hypothetical protein
MSFDEFVEYGINAGGNVVNGMPWSFVYSGHSISHENDDCYLITTMRGQQDVAVIHRDGSRSMYSTARFERGDRLYCNLNGALYVVRKQ